MRFPLDRRTRRNVDLRTIEPTSFFRDDFPRYAEESGDLVIEAVARLNAPPLCVEVDGEPWSIEVHRGALVARTGLVPNAPTISLSTDQFSDWAQDLRSLNAFHVGMELPLRNGGELDVSIWDSLWRCLLDGWPVVGDLDFVDRTGRPLRLDQIFTPADDPADIGHFLREAGFLHLRGWIDADAIDRVSAEIDAARVHYHEGDDRSWWAELQDGTRTIVRMQRFVEHSPTTRQVLDSDLWRDLVAAVAGSDTVQQGRPGPAVTEALVKPVGVKAGISDLTFHRDCHFGRHAYGCSGIDIGITVTSSSPANGCLGVVAGSHRLAIPVEIAKSAPYLPVIGVATEAGDCTVHLSCTLHESTAPRASTRKVMYTPYKLLPLAHDVEPPTPAGGDLRERVHRMHLPAPSSA
jgi:hypothetical protein